MDEPISFSFSQAVYSLTTIKKAALRYAGHFIIDIQHCGDSISVALRPKPDVPFTGPDAQNFPNDVLDQDLREIVAKETRQTTELLLAQAFSNLPLTDPVAEEAVIGDDPHHIASCSASTAKRTAGE